jgi:hypothetical protein
MANVGAAKFLGHALGDHSDEFMPISAEPSMPQSDTVFTRALAKLSLAELRALWAAEADIPATFRLRQCEYREARSAVAEPRRNSSVLWQDV